MRIKVPANKPYFSAAQRQQIAATVADILESGRLTQGPWVRKFEEAFAHYVGARFAIAVNSGTSALEILLRYFDVKDREVIVPTNTFIATANAVIFAGGVPVLADISSDTLCIDPGEIERRLTPETKGVIVVHIAGLICPHIDEIRQLCNANGLFLVEDAAHAPGAAIGSQKAGALADGAAFSFYPSKPLTTGEGGMITTNDPDCDRFARSVRSHGMNTQAGKGSSERNVLARLGYNWRMSDLQAMLGYYQLQNLEGAISLRNRAARIYERELRHIPGISLIQTPQNFRHSHYKFPILFDKPFSREQVINSFEKEFGIQVGSIYYPPCHLQPFYREKFGYQIGDYPVAEDILPRTVALPIFPDLSIEDALAVCQAVIAIAKRQRVSRFNNETLISEKGIDHD